ncbi:Uncharacterized protein FKW44_012435, partial [Caligus rogercresseyi]
MVYDHSKPEDFIFPLLRGAKQHISLTPWHCKFLVKEPHSERADEIVKTHLFSLGFPGGWRKKILVSLVGINDPRKFTAQLQISANLIRFSEHCKDCGYMYVDIKHASVI